MELKFRAWIEKCQTMLEAITIYTDMIGLHYQSFEDQLKDLEYDGEYVIKDDDVIFTPLQGEEWIFIEPKDYTIMQFTGFKDCEDNDIYQGDILSDEVMTDEGLKMSLQQVFWCQTSGSWKLDFSHTQNKSASQPLATEIKAYQYKIVGNIYESPGILKSN